MFKYSSLFVTPNIRQTYRYDLTVASGFPTASFLSRTVFLTKITHFVFQQRDYNVT